MSKIAIIGLVGNSAFMSVPSFHKGGETVTADSVHFEPGGKGFNQGVAAARYGAEVAFLGAVGQEGAQTIAAFAEREGIHAHLPVKTGPTAYAVILTDALGANQVTVCQGATLTVEDVEDFASHLREAEILLINNEVPEEVNLRAVEIALQSGTRVICNPAPARPTCAYLLEKVELFTPNEFERDALGQQNNMVVTLGGKGCLISATGECVPACTAGPVVDTTGAGDTFNGVLAAELAQGASLRKAVEQGIKAAGLGITRPYAATSIPTRKEILEAY